MTNIQIQKILNEALNKSFLDKILFLTEQEREYKKSDFFKTTKIPLLTLHEKYEMYKMKNNQVIEEFNNFIKEIDVDLVTGKLEELVLNLEKNKTIVNMVNDFIENFNYEKVNEYAIQIQEEMNKLKK